MSDSSTSKKLTTIGEKKAENRRQLTKSQVKLALSEFFSVGEILCAFNPKLSKIWLLITEEPTIETISNVDNANFFRCEISVKTTILKQTMVLYPLKEFPQKIIFYGLNGTGTMHFPYITLPNKLEMHLRIKNLNGKEPFSNFFLRNLNDRGRTSLFVVKATK